MASTSETKTQANDSPALPPMEQHSGRSLAMVILGWFLGGLFIYALLFGIVMSGLLIWGIVWSDCPIDVQCTYHPDRDALVQNTFSTSFRVRVELDAYPQLNITRPTCFENFIEYKIPQKDLLPTVILSPLCFVFTEVCWRVQYFWRGLAVIVCALILGFARMVHVKRRSAVSGQRRDLEE